MSLSRSAARAKPRWLALIVVIFLTMFAAVPIALANLPGSPFDAFDGNLVLDNETQDWVNAPNRQEGFDQPTGQNDDSFGQGTKEDTEVPAIVSGSIPNNKSDLLRFYVANQKVGTDEFLYLAWERVQEPSGTTNMDFEFNQSGTPSANGVTPVRTAGDLLIKYDLAQGGTTPILGYHIWVTAASAAADPDIPDTAAGACEATNKFPCWGKVVGLDNTDFEGSINTVAVNDPIFDADHPCDPDDAPNCNTLSVRTFGEAAINLTGSDIFDPSICQGFGSAYLKSRSSDSFTAALKDFIAPVQVSISNCGGIIVQKETDPDGDAQVFAFTADYDADGFSLSDGQSNNSGDLQAGTYSVAETVPTGWELTSATCDDGSDPSSIDLAAGETVTCTFNNQADTSITVIKQTDPDGDAQVFTFAADYDLDGFGLSDGQSNPSGDLAPGSYDVSESVPAGWDLDGISCVGDAGVQYGDGTTFDGTFDAGTDDTARVDLDAGENVTCTFTNEKDATITIKKETDQNGDTTLFGFNGSWDIGDPPDFQLADGGSQSSGDLEPGQYSSNELVPSGWHVTDIACVTNDLAEAVVIGSDNDFDDGDNSVSISLEAGENVTCTFTNTRFYKIYVITCDDATDQIVLSAVSLDGGTTVVSTMSPAALAGLLDDPDAPDDICDLPPTFGNLFAGTYDMDIELPDVPGGLEP